jgi:hypothetical protein
MAASRWSSSFLASRTGFQNSAIALHDDYHDYAGRHGHLGRRQDGHQMDDVHGPTLRPEHIDQIPDHQQPNDDCRSRPKLDSSFRH